MDVVIELTVPTSPGNAAVGDEVASVRSAPLDAVLDHDAGDLDACCGTTAGWCLSCAGQSHPDELIAVRVTLDDVAKPRTKAGAGNFALFGGAVPWTGDPDRPVIGSRVEFVIWHGLMVHDACVAAVDARTARSACPGPLAGAADRSEYGADRACHSNRSTANAVAGQDQRGATGEAGEHGEERDELADGETSRPLIQHLLGAVFVHGHVPGNETPRRSHALSVDPGDVAAADETRDERLVP